MNLFHKNMGTTQMNNNAAVRQTLIERYSNVPVGKNESGEDVIVDLLEDFTSPHDKSNMALILENTAKLIQESTNTASSGAYEVVAFPMVRRVFARLLANDIVSTQAMATPEAVMHFFYPQISDRVEKDLNGTTYYEHPSYYNKLPDCVTHNCPETVVERCRSLYDLYYDDALYDHSKGAFRIVVATGDVFKFTDDGCETGDTIAGAEKDSKGGLRALKMQIQAFSEVPRLNALTARLKKGNAGLTYDTNEFLSSFRVTYVGSTPLVMSDGTEGYTSGEVVDVRLVAQRYGNSISNGLASSYLDYCDVKGNLLVELLTKRPTKDCATCTDVDGYVGIGTGSVATLEPTDFIFSWREYLDLEENSSMGEVTFDIRKDIVSVKPRKLRARWSPELAADVKAYHNIDAEAELTNMMAEQIAMEIDREILLELKNGAAWVLHWDFYGWKTQGSQKYTEKEWKQTFITKVNQISAQIHKSTLRGGANFIVVSTEISALLDDLANFMPNNKNVDDDKYNLGMQRIGTLAGRYDVYVDPYAKAHEALIGYKGSNLLDTGYIFAPYQPVEITPTITTPESFDNVKGVRSRYATKMVNNRYYGRIIVDRIPTFDSRELR